MHTNHKTKTIHALASKAPASPLVPFEYEAPPLGPWDIEVEISHCGVCHSDLHLFNNDWKLTSYPFVPGHEIIGMIKQKGELVAELDIGMRVGIGWQGGSCHTCEWCHTGEENLCLNQQATCVGHFGGFADSIITDSRFAFKIPELLKSENAAPLLCGGATVFSPLLQHANPTMRVGVIGVGGLGHLALQFAKAFGYEVFSFSSSPSKEEEAKLFGAHHFISSMSKKELAKVASKIDLLLCTSSASMDWESLINTLRPKGKLCLLGAPGEPLKVAIMQLINGRRSISGSNIANPPDINKMLHFASLHGIVAKTEIFPMHEANTALKKLADNQIHYRAVLKN